MGGARSCVQWLLSTSRSREKKTPLPRELDVDKNAKNACSRCAALATRATAMTADLLMLNATPKKKMQLATANIAPSCARLRDYEIGGCWVYGRWS